MEKPIGSHWVFKIFKVLFKWTSPGSGHETKYMETAHESRIFGKPRSFKTTRLPSETGLVRGPRRRPKASKDAFLPDFFLISIYIVIKNYVWMCLKILFFKPSKASTALESSVWGRIWFLSNLHYIHHVSKIDKTSPKLLRVWHRQFEEIRWHDLWDAIFSLSTFEDMPFTSIYQGNTSQRHFFKCISALLFVVGFWNLSVFSLGIAPLELTTRPRSPYNT